MHLTALTLAAASAPLQLEADETYPQRCTAIRAANGRARPPPLSREEWLAVVEQHIPAGTKVVLRTDGAQAYGPSGPADGMQHARVKHSGPLSQHSRRTLVAGCWVVARTQALDGCWRHLKKTSKG
eukprot:2758041-Amphidinium_carterae.1